MGEITTKILRLGIIWSFELFYNIKEREPWPL